MRRNPERVAWSVLLLSFAACLTLTVSVPLAIRSFVTESTDASPRRVEVQQGTLLLRRPLAADFAGITDATTDVPDGSELKADQSTQAVLTVREQNTDTNLVIVQMYANTDLTVSSAASPRFDASPRPHRLALALSTGRVRVNVLSNTARPVAATIHAPQAEVTLSPGTFTLEVTNEELQVTARDGTATVAAQGAEVDIKPSQRARVLLGRAPQGGLSNERNLVVDGSFVGVPLGAWSAGHDLQVEQESLGTVEFRTVSGRRAAWFDRQGQSHAETRLVQTIDRDVRDAASLTLHMAARIDFQDVPVCGSLGSECPLMVRINYVDTIGSPREWVQGFYYLPDTNPVDPNNPNRPFCATCNPPRNDHERVTPDAWFTYDSPNLIDLLTVDTFKPAHITVMTIYASGHSYRSAVTDVELLVQE